MNGTVTISLSDFEKLKSTSDKYSDLLPKLEEVREDIDIILKETHIYGDMDRISKEYNSKGRKTIMTLKPNGWKLIKRQL